MKEAAQAVERIFCNSCGQDTDHVLVAEYRNQEFREPVRDGWGNIIAEIDGHHDWEMLECMGCKSVSLRQCQYFSEWCDPHDGMRTKDTYYPPRIKNSRAKPTWHEDLIGLPGLQGHFILAAYEQIYDLLAFQNYIAAMLTCRALLETLAVEQVGDEHRTFRGKLEALKDRGFILERQIEFLNKSIYDAGSAAMHRSYNPTAQAVIRVLDAIEKLLHTIYIEPLVADELEAAKPPRKK